MNKTIISSLLSAILAVSAVGVSMPAASAAPAAAPAGSNEGSNIPASKEAGKTVLPALDLALVSRAMAGLPNKDATAALVFVGTPSESWMGASGVSDIRTKTPARADGRFRIGSITKVFTAAVVLQLAAEGKVDLEQPIQTYLPGLLPEAYPPVRVGQLLNHTSGLPSPKLPEGIKESDLPGIHWTPKEVVGLAVNQPMEFEPGTRQHYVNINYFLAGLLIEEITGNTYETEVESRIIAPLHLYDTYLPGSDIRILGTHAMGYQAVEQDGVTQLEDVTEGSQSFTWAAGQIISTTSDLDSFMTALFGGHVVPAAQLEHMFTVPEVPLWSADGKDAGPATMSMGMSRAVIQGIAFWGKTGARPGYANGMFATRDLERRVVYSVNSTDAKGAGENKLGLRIAMSAFGAQPKPAP
ncbi:MULTISPECIES: serine hydrolase domain-containing protein [Paenibacillus]|uniref:serine hydrolase domain-containing protein n=1 Tax=Paenibacillus TaxID=44249 RepID=UPI0022B8E2F1|nr:serine hydrolase domain-containing protein [Paenibacillus caseinilyticus]MCZ8519211.1 serine hydrolase [Paenibacillus caseinilyticus]